MRNARRVHLSVAAKKLKRMTEVIIVKSYMKYAYQKFYGKILVLLNLYLIDKRREDVDDCLS
ncbi:MAG: hypothetical protein ACTS77_03505 [Arsenophonus sp. NC-TX2-MAG3]